MYSQENNKQYMDILKLTLPLTEQSIKSAYRKFVKTNHPDLFKSSENKELATKKFKKGTEAYEYLLKHYESINSTDNNNNSNSTNNTDNNNNTSSSGNKYSKGARTKEEEEWFNSDEWKERHKEWENFNPHEWEQNHYKYSKTKQTHKKQDKPKRKQNNKDFKEIYNKVFKDVKYENLEFI